eukprot:ctg_448.g216
MGERKVLNKYYPPDFDPEKLPRGKRPKDSLEAVRFMLPMTVRCKTCGEYMYAGKKFNAKKETVKNEDYLGIKIYRFYIKCASCSSPFTIKTDPKNADYVCEHGVYRNYELWKQQEQLEKEVDSLKKEQEEDAMQALENKTMDMKEEMELLDTLDELKALKAREAKLDPDYLLQRQQRYLEKEKQENKNTEENELVDLFHRTKKRNPVTLRLEEPEETDKTDTPAHYNQWSRKKASNDSFNFGNKKIRLNVIKKETGKVSQDQNIADKKLMEQSIKERKSSIVSLVDAYASD